MKKGTPRLQHYVPQLLLRRFAGPDGKLWAYDTAERKMFASGPRALAAEGYFYGGTTAHPTPESTHIERWLAKEIEAPAAESIGGLLARQLLSPQQAHAFFRFVAAQMQRTPASLKRTGDSFVATFQETAERIAKHEPTFRENFIAEVKASGASDEEIAEFIDILNEGQFTVAPTREFVISAAFGVLPVLATELSKMKWTFLNTHPTDGDLILGDHPVTLTDVAPQRTLAGALGVKNPNVEIAMPLSPKMVALAHWDGPISFGEMAPGMVEILNERTLQNIYRFAYAPFKSEELLTKAASLHGTGPKTYTHWNKIGERLIITNLFR